MVQQSHDSDESYSCTCTNNCRQNHTEEAFIEHEGENNSTEEASGQHLDGNKCEENCREPCQRQRVQTVSENSLKICYKDCNAPCQFSKYDDDSHFCRRDCQEPCDGKKNNFGSCFEECTERCKDRTGSDGKNESFSCNNDCKKPCETQQNKNNGKPDKTSGSCYKECKEPCQFSNRDDESYSCRRDCKKSCDSKQKNESSCFEGCEERCKHRKDGDRDSESFPCKYDCKKPCKIQQNTNNGKTEKASGSCYKECKDPCQFSKQDDESYSCKRDCKKPCGNQQSNISSCFEECKERCKYRKDEVSDSESFPCKYDCKKPCVNQQNIKNEKPDKTSGSCYKECKEPCQFSKHDDESYSCKRDCKKPCGDQQSNLSFCFEDCEERCKYRNDEDSDSESFPCKYDCKKPCEDQQNTKKEKPDKTLVSCYKECKEPCQFSKHDDKSYSCRRDCKKPCDSKQNNYGSCYEKCEERCKQRKAEDVDDNESFYCKNDCKKPCKNQQSTENEKPEKSPGSCFEKCRAPCKNVESDDHNRSYSCERDCVKPCDEARDATGEQKERTCFCTVTCKQPDGCCNSENNQDSPEDKSKPTEANAHSPDSSIKNNTDESEDDENTHEGNRGNKNKPNAGSGSSQEDCKKEDSNDKPNKDDSPDSSCSKDCKKPCKERGKSKKNDAAKTCSCPEGCKKPSKNGKKGKEDVDSGSCANECTKPCDEGRKSKKKAPEPCSCPEDCNEGGEKDDEKEKRKKRGRFKPCETCSNRKEFTYEDYIAGASGGKGDDTVKSRFQGIPNAFPTLTELFGPTIDDTILDLLLVFKGDDAAKDNSKQNGGSGNNGAGPDGNGQNQDKKLGKKKNGKSGPKDTHDKETRDDNSLTTDGDKSKKKKSEKTCDMDNCPNIDNADSGQSKPKSKKKNESPKSDGGDEKSENRDTSKKKGSKKDQNQKGSNKNGNHDSKEDVKGKDSKGEIENSFALRDVFGPSGDEVVIAALSKLWALFASNDDGKSGKDNGKDKQKNAPKQMDGSDDKKPNKKGGKKKKKGGNDGDANGKNKPNKGNCFCDPESEKENETSRKPNQDKKPSENDNDDENGGRETEDRNRSNDDVRNGREEESDQYAEQDEQIYEQDNRDSENKPSTNKYKINHCSCRHDKKECNVVKQDAQIHEQDRRDSENKPSANKYKMNHCSCRHDKKECTNVVKQDAQIHEQDNHDSDNKSSANKYQLKHCSCGNDIKDVRKCTILTKHDEPLQEEGNHKSDKGKVYYNGRNCSCDHDITDGKEYTTVVNKCETLRENDTSDGDINTHRSHGRNCSCGQERTEYVKECTTITNQGAQPDEHNSDSDQRSTTSKYQRIKCSNGHDKTEIKACITVVNKEARLNEEDSSDGCNSTNRSNKRNSLSGHDRNGRENDYETHAVRDGDHSDIDKQIEPKEIIHGNQKEEQKCVGDVEPIPKPRANVSLDTVGIDIDPVEVPSEGNVKPTVDKPHTDKHTDDDSTICKIATALLEQNDFASLKPEAGESVMNFVRWLHQEYLDLANDMETLSVDLDNDDDDDTDSRYKILKERQGTLDVVSDFLEKRWQFDVSSLISPWSKNSRGVRCPEVGAKATGKIVLPRNRGTRRRGTSGKWKEARSDEEETWRKTSTHNTRRRHRTLVPKLPKDLNARTAKHRALMTRDDDCQPGSTSDTSESTSKHSKDDIHKSISSTFTIHLLGDGSTPFDTTGIHYKSGVHNDVKPAGVSSSGDLQEPSLFTILALAESTTEGESDLYSGTTLDSLDISRLGTTTEESDDTLIIYQTEDWNSPKSLRTYKPSATSEPSSGEKPGQDRTSFTKKRRHEPRSSNIVSMGDTKSDASKEDKKSDICRHKSLHIIAEESGDDPWSSLYDDGITSTTHNNNKRPGQKRQEVNPKRTALKEVLPARFNSISTDEKSSGCLSSMDWIAQVGSEVLKTSKASSVIERERYDIQNEACASWEKNVFHCNALRTDQIVRKHKFIVDQDAVVHNDGHDQSTEKGGRHGQYKRPPMHVLDYTSEREYPEYVFGIFHPEKYGVNLETLWKTNAKSDEFRSSTFLNNPDFSFPPNDPDPHDTECNIIHDKNPLFNEDSYSTHSANESGYDSFNSSSCFNDTDVSSLPSDTDTSTTECTIVQDKNPNFTEDSCSLSTNESGFDSHQQTKSRNVYDEDRLSGDSNTQERVEVIYVPKTNNHQQPLDSMDDTDSKSEVTPSSTSISTCSSTSTVKSFRSFQTQTSAAILTPAERDVDLAKRKYQFHERSLKDRTKVDRSLQCPSTDVSSAGDKMIGGRGGLISEGVGTSGPVVDIVQPRKKNTQEGLETRDNKKLHKASSCKVDEKGNKTVPSETGKWSRGIRPFLRRRYESGNETSPKQRAQREGEGVNDNSEKPSDCKTKKNLINHLSSLDSHPKWKKCIAYMSKNAVVHGESFLQNFKEIRPHSENVEERFGVNRDASISESSNWSGDTSSRTDTYESGTDFTDDDSFESYDERSPIVEKGSEKNEKNDTKQSQQPPASTVHINFDGSGRASVEWGPGPGKKKSDSGKERKPKKEKPAKPPKPEPKKISVRWSLVHIQEYNDGSKVFTFSNPVARKPIFAKSEVYVVFVVPPGASNNKEPSKKESKTNESKPKESKSKESKPKESKSKESKPKESTPKGSKTKVKK